MTDDVRCCGTGTCIINADGVCWCGQHWDGEKMSFPRFVANTVVSEPTPPLAQTESKNVSTTASSRE